LVPRITEMPNCGLSSSLVSANCATTVPSSDLTSTIVAKDHSPVDRFTSTSLPLNLPQPATAAAGWLGVCATASGDGDCVCFLRAAPQLLHFSRFARFDSSQCRHCQCASGDGTALDDAEDVGPCHCGSGDSTVQCTAFTGDNTCVVAGIITASPPTSCSPSTVV